MCEAQSIRSMTKVIAPTELTRKANTTSGDSTETSTPT
jgi:hypothetical protein